jgi:hypothetical protein
VSYESSKRTRRRTILLTNLVLLALLIGMTFLQMEMYVRDRDEFWMSGWWLLVQFALAFGGNVVTVQGNALRRSGYSLLAALALGMAWLGSLAFCAQVLGIRYALT